MSSGCLATVFGPVQLVIDPNQNLSGAIFEGLDYEAIYILDSTIFGGSDWGRLTTTVNGTWLSRAEFQARPDTKRFGIAGEFLPPAFTLTSSLPWHRANFSIFYDGPADTWMQGLDVGAVVHWIGQYEDDNASLTGSPKSNAYSSGIRPTPELRPSFRDRARKVSALDHARPASSTTRLISHRLRQQKCRALPRTAAKT